MTSIRKLGDYKFKDIEAAIDVQEAALTQLHRAVGKQISRLEVEERMLKMLKEQIEQEAEEHGVDIDDLKTAAMAFEEERKEKEKTAKEASVAAAEAARKAREEEEAKKAKGKRRGRGKKTEEGDDDGGAPASKKRRKKKQKKG